MDYISLVQLGLSGLIGLYFFGSVGFSRFNWIISPGYPGYLSSPGYVGFFFQVVLGSISMLSWVLSSG